MAGEEVRVVAKPGDRLSLEFEFRNDPNGAPSAAADARNAPIFHEDTPSLNNLDWTKPAQTAVDYVHSHDFGTTVRLPRADLAHYRPDTITVSSTGRKYRAAGARSPSREAARAARTTFRVWHSGGANGGDDDDDDDDKTLDKSFIYFITAKTAPAQPAP